MSFFNKLDVCVEKRQGKLFWGECLCYWSSITYKCFVNIKYGVK